MKLWVAHHDNMCMRMFISRLGDLACLEVAIEN